MEKVSIIIPMYNSQDYILDCLKNIQKQSYKNYVVLIIDDGSVDGSVELCNEYIEKNKIKNIKVLTKENGGPSSARNFGIRNANTEFICFVDSDDSITEDYLLNLLNNKDDLVVSGYIDKFKTTCRNVNIVDKKLIINKKDISDYILQAKTVQFFNPPFNKLYRLNIIKNNNLYFDENLKMGEDFKFNIEYLKQCNSITLIPDCIYIYNHINENALTCKFKENRWEIEKELFNTFCSFFSKTYIKNNENDINEYLLTSINKTVYTLLKSDLTKKYKKEYLKKIFSDSILKNRKYNCSKLSNKITYISLKLKNYKFIEVFYKLKILLERIKTKNV